MSCLRQEPRFPVTALIGLGDRLRLAVDDPLDLVLGPSEQLGDLADAEVGEIGLGRERTAGVLRELGRTSVGHDQAGKRALGR